jgi:hypothetical protein
VLQRGDAYHCHNTQVPAKQEQTNKQARINNKQQTCAADIKYFVVQRDEIRTLFNKNTDMMKNTRTGATQKNNKRTFVLRSPLSTCFKRSQNRTSFSKRAKKASDLLEVVTRFLLPDDRAYPLCTNEYIAPHSAGLVIRPNNVYNNVRGLWVIDISCHTLTPAHCAW